MYAYTKKKEDQTKSNYQIMLSPRAKYKDVCELHLASMHTYLRAPLKAEQRVEKVDAFTREDPSVVGARQPSDIGRRQCPCLCLSLVLSCRRLIELLDQLEEIVEVVSGQVIQEELKLWRAVMSSVEFLAMASYDANHLGDEAQCVRPR
jgi:hypothetical protein